MVLGVIAEQSLPLSIAPVLVNLAQTLALDKMALAQLKLSRTAATYKMVNGLARTFSYNSYIVVVQASHFLFLTFVGDVPQGSVSVHAYPCHQSSEVCAASLALCI